MKLFEVTIDNNPGGWKSGSDPYVLVIAETKEEAIEMVKNGYSKKFLSSSENDGEYAYMYGKFEGEYERIYEDTRLSAIEIKFQGLEITTVREQKLKRILEDGKNEN